MVLDLFFTLSFLFAFFSEEGARRLQIHLLAWLVMFSSLVLPRKMKVTKFPIEVFRTIASFPTLP